ncbi:MAG: MFS transporter [Thermodesulfobacteriota bacterium]
MRWKRGRDRSGPGPALPAGHWRSYLLLLARNPAFRRFWLAGVISHLGNWLNYVAIFVLLGELAGAGQAGPAVSGFLLAKFLPPTLLGPAAGVVADRISRKAIMVACDLGRAALVLGFLAVRQPEQVWLVYLLALLQESFWTFFDPARRASVPNLCTAEELLPANALAGATWSIMLALGAALGGFFTAAFGWQAAIVMDSLTFVISAVLIAGVPIPGERPLPRAWSWRQLSGLPDLWEGGRYLRGEPAVATLLLVKSGWALSGGILVMLTVFGEQVLRSGGHGIGAGILYSMRGLGAAVGPVLAWRLLGEGQTAMARGIGLAFFISAASYLLFSQSPSLAWAAPCVFAGHVGGSVQWVFSTVMLQQRVPDRFRGRVFAAEMGLLTLVLSLSTFLTGQALAAGLSPRAIVMALAGLFALPGTLWLAIGRRRLRDDPA